MNQWINPLLKGQDLSIDEAKQCLTYIFETPQSVQDLGALFSAMHQKGESVSELVGFSLAIRNQAVALEPLAHPLLDVCGTGGVLSPRFNTSTASAFILSAGNVGVAKHGNRGSSSATGGFDFLESLTVPFEQTPYDIGTLFANTQLCFLYARHFHPAMKAVAEARRQLGHRSIFNLVGPLSNPAGADFHVLGTPSKTVGEKLAHALRQLGTTRALVITGQGGYDEFVLAGTTEGYEVINGQVKPFTYDATEDKIDIEGEVVVGQTSAENAKLFTQMIQTGDADTPLARQVCLNAGAGFYCVGNTDSILAGYKKAQDLIRSREVWAQFLKYRTFAQELTVK